MSSPRTIPWDVSTARMLLGLIVLTIVVVLVFAVDRLGPPYYAISHLIGYVVLLGYVVARLRACFRMARSTQSTSRLRSVAFWLGLTAVATLGRIPFLLMTQDHHYARLATDVGLLFALMYALELIESLLKATEPSPIAGESAGPDSAP